MRFTLIFIGTTIYHFCIYPLILLFAGVFLKKKKLETGKKKYSVSVIIPVFNEDKNIESKVKNTLVALKNYTGEIIVVSDGSTDKTNHLLKNLKAENRSIVKTIVCDQRSGKAAAINTALPECTGELVLITDANVFLDCKFFSEIIKMYNEFDCDCVFGNLIYSSFSYSSLTVGENSYWSWDKLLSTLETCSGLGSATGIIGSLLSFKTELIKEIPANAILDDMELLAILLEKKKKSLFCSKAFGYEIPARTTYDGIVRKERIISGIYGWMMRRKFGKMRFLDLFFLFSHKISRWSLPLLFILHLIECMKDGPVILRKFYKLFFILPVFEAIGRFIISLFSGVKDIKIKWFFVPFYLICMMVSFIIGTLRHFSGKATVMWKISER
ncbi:glycosyltransferase [bacterium]|nr:glycosyltransferase [bacterium]